MVLKNNTLRGPAAGEKQIPTVARNGQFSVRTDNNITQYYPPIETPY